MSTPYQSAVPGTRSEPKLAFDVQSARPTDSRSIASFLEELERPVLKTRQLSPPLASKLVRLKCLFRLI